MIVLNTNVVSELAKLQPEQTVIEWVDTHNSSELMITALTAAEIRAGVGLLPEGRRKQEIGTRMESLLTETFAGYVLAFDIGPSVYCADILETQTRGGRPISVFDAQLAAVCRQHNSVLATRNIADFTGTGLQLVNPWDAGLAT
ncbi:type II toxin-antitoxin system VapC family toxin [Arthrobacter sp. H5]|uniref:type II toxin-antitoxin system VapC family toxin n=1 Tax=Arthrobacter sp. H5 TaxID=1267973 RepID=UPI000489ECE0|nr:type II toxin-antitoxin system VapC family toxin [Arthrobacter sp. H5]